MKVVSFSCKIYDRQQLCRILPPEWESEYVEPTLDKHTVVYADGADVITAFVNDRLDLEILQILAEYGVKMIALRCAGFNNVDLVAAHDLGIKVARVPAYSPYAVAEHTVGLMLALNRKLYRAYNRVREGNFSLNGMLGFDFHGKTIGIVGAGKIGRLVGKMLKAFGCEVLVYDPYLCKECPDLGLQQVSLEEIYQRSDVISLHCPLTEETNHLVNAESIAKMKKGVMLINTGRGALMDTEALIEGLKSGRIGYLGMDVYEKEGALFFEDHSCEIIQDDAFERLLTFHNVLITGHQAYFTEEALRHIAETTRDNIQALIEGAPLENEIEVC
ncbi:2-hydroxyacid dehydrogenase [Thiomicrorhabdus sp. 6S3-12]|uniref:2-hydroxyacid dehydrogenase n=1 Tax=Thiomicrorhabdus sp. 6S3-12 TaxID=2819681 RepID=UPI001AACCB89|nr:2-hydroxyacid dehydrogenase [Thiomicrorhabdus sp. 6S3-12]MBO1924754.1 2-hydroxyacid dehydrogenase [Thiomicrorhabdus sp. 6S3-12]